MDLQGTERKGRRHEVVSNVPISAPVLHPDAEIADMNGFAWTPDGLVVAMGESGLDMVDRLRRLREGDPQPYGDASSPTGGG